MVDTQTERRSRKTQTGTVHHFHHRTITNRQRIAFIDLKQLPHFIDIKVLW